jgi:hypothetical protein
LTARLLVVRNVGRERLQSFESRRPAHCRPLWS